MLINAHLSWRRRLWTGQRPVKLADSALEVTIDPSEVIAAREGRFPLDGLARARAVLILRWRGAGGVLPVTHD